MTSTYYLLVKFPTEYGVGETHEDQIAHCECYIAIALNIEERWVKVEPTEALEDVSLDDERLNQTTRIGTQSFLLVCKELTLFLRNILEVFTWSHKDMPRIDPNTVVHRINVFPSFPPFSKRRGSSTKKGSKP